MLADPRGEVQRGPVVDDFACGIPTCSRSDFSDQVSSGVDTFSFPRAARSFAGMNVELSGDGADVDEPGRHRLRHASF